MGFLNTLILLEKFYFSIPVLLWNLDVDCIVLPLVAEDLKCCFWIFGQIACLSYVVSRF